MSEALQIAGEDLDYLHALKRAVRSALSDGADREQAIAAARRSTCHAVRGMTMAGCGMTMPNSSSPSSLPPPESCPSYSASSEL